MLNLYNNYIYLPLIIKCNHLVFATSESQHSHWWIVAPLTVQWRTVPIKPLKCPNEGGVFLWQDFSDPA
jgi:hypothetical protein